MINTYLARQLEHKERDEQLYFAKKKGSMFIEDPYGCEVDTLLRKLSDNGIDPNEFLSKYLHEDTLDWLADNIIHGFKTWNGIGETKVTKRLVFLSNQIINGKRHFAPIKIMKTFQQVHSPIYSFSKVVFLKDNSYAVFRSSTAYSGTCLNLYRLDKGKWKMLDSINCWYY